MAIEVTPPRPASSKPDSSSRITASSALRISGTRVGPSDIPQLPRDDGLSDVGHLFGEVKIAVNLKAVGARHGAEDAVFSSESAGVVRARGSRHPSSHEPRSRPIDTVENLHVREDET